ncbi:hypothetical protein B0H14DRAFT_2764056 [Mycena olivaceomarginata]|nr:hypothetical protein B0H14DRAFT_2764056 [Mycena olivaceomarginata]
MLKPELTPPSKLGGWIHDVLGVNVSDLYGHSSSILGLVLLCTVVLFVAWKRRTLVAAPKKSVDSSRTPNPKRPFGEWLPQSFTYPEFEPSMYAPNEIKPPMYRPFRWGEYHVTMGIRNMHFGEWIELDDQYDAYYRIRKDRVERKGKDVVQVLPPSTRVRQGEEPVHIGGGAPAAIELVHELAEYLSRRYPKTFQITRHKSMADYPTGWGGETPIKSVRIVHLREEFELPLPPSLNVATEKRDIEQEGTKAMRIAGLLVQDDLALMIEGSDGGYYFMAGAILVPGFWRMRDKLGMRLEEIHTSGNVPEYEEKLQTSLERFFRRLAVDKPVARNNYFVQVSPLPSVTPSVDPEELAWGENVLGPEEVYGGTKGSSFGSPSDLVVTPQTLRLRTERQTLRRLPRSGAVVFTIRTYLVPMEELAREPGVAARFASAVRSWPEGIKEYKGERRYGDVLVRYLEDMAREGGEPEVKPYPY